MTDSERVELNELCSATVDNVITDAQRDRLQELLRGSEEARQFYVRAMQMSASLYSYASEMQSEPADANIVQVPAWRWQRALWPIAAAAAVLLAAFLIFRTVDPRADDPDIDYVARLTGSKDCQWIGSTLSPGDEVAAGQRLDLKAGFAELTFDSGAQLMVQGPAQVDVHSAWEAELRRGTLKANVPQEAIGFRVMNAAVDVVDLGTEFSISANDDGAAEVFVLKGSVEVHPRDGKGNRQAKAVLGERQARRFAKVGPGGAIHNPEERFQQLMRKVAIDRLAKPLNYARWSFDEDRGREVGVTAPNHAASALKLSSDPARVDGRYGSALEFDGTFTARADLQPPLRRGIRTLAFWARVPADNTSLDGGVFASFGSQKPWGGILELGWNRAPGDGVLGALRFQAPAGYVVGSTPMRDGRWHHVALVVGNPGNNARPPLKLYVDGRLEPFSGRFPIRRSTEMSKEEPALWIGGSPKTGERFHGMLDELVIADQPLTPQEIRHLIRSNALLSPEAIAGL